MFQLKEKKQNVSHPLIQTSLKIGQPGDKYEQEADAVADRVMRMSENEKMQMQPIEEEEEELMPKLRMQPLEEVKEMMQPKSESDQLSHVVQQNKGINSKKNDSKFIQKAPTLEILDENFIGPPASDQRRAVASCPIYCNGLTNIGTLHSMGLFYHQSRSGVRQTPAAGDNGVGTALHFMGNASHTGCPYNEIKIIQIITTTHPATGRSGSGYVDNAGRNTPFYGDVYASGTGEHTISVAGDFQDEGESVETTHSIYDSPYRSTTGLNATIQWEAEANVACVRNTGPDHILGGISYGFRLPYNSSTNSYETIQGIGPSCHRTPSGNFINTLQTDPSVSGYNFTYEMGLGDFPLPDSSTSVA